MAIILTLLMAALLLMLAGAFLQINRSNFQGSLAADREQRAHQAALTGLEYARMRLESYQQWGIPKSKSDVAINVANFRVVEDHDYKPSGAIHEFVSVGILDGGQSHFQIEFLTAHDPVNSIANGRISDADIEKNPGGTISSWLKSTLNPTDISLNYMNETNATAQPLTGPESPARTLPRTRARILVTGYCKGVIKRADVTVGQESFTNAGIAAGRNLVIQSNFWNPDSKITDTNRINSTGNTVLPGAEGGNPNKPAMKFRGGWGGANAGTLAAQGTVKTGANAVIGAGPDGLGGISLSYSASPPVAPTNFNLASSNVNGTLDQYAGVPGVASLDAPTVESWSNFGAAKPLPGGTYTFIGHENVVHSNGTTYNKSIDPGGGKAIELRDFKFIVPEDTRVNVNSNIRIRSNPGLKAPTVAMGYNKDGWLNSNKKGGMLNVQNGNLTVSGSLVGKGSVIINGTALDPNSHEMKIQGASQMSGSTDLGVTVYADGPITVSAPTDSDFFGFDWDSLASTVDKFGTGKWATTGKPMAKWKTLAKTDQNFYMGGTAANDSIVDPTYLRSKPMTALAATGAVANLTTNFSSYSANATVQSEFDYLVGNYTLDGGITPGRYIRLREFLKESQTALLQGTALPSASDTANVGGNLSNWADSLKNSDLVNDYLVKELEWFQSEGEKNNWSWDLKNVVTQASNPISASLNYRDAKWKGLLYSKQSILVDAGTGSFELEGSAVAKKDIVVRNADHVYTNYDPSYFDELSKFKTGSVIVQKLTYLFYTVY